MYYFPLLHLHQDSFPLFIISGTFHFVLEEDMCCSKSNLTRNRLLFPSPERLGIVGEVFFHLPEKQGLGKDLRNS
jgi:hypothetical protein